MKSWALLRAVAWLKRLAIAAERQAEAQERIATAAEGMLPRHRTAPRMASVHTPSIDEMNDRWEKRDYEED